MIVIQHRLFDLEVSRMRSGVSWHGNIRVLLHSSPRSLHSHKVLGSIWHIPTGNILAPQPVLLIIQHAGAHLSPLCLKFALEQQRSGGTFPLAQNAGKWWACWWALPWSLEILSNATQFPLKFLRQISEMGCFFWELKFTEGGWVPVFLFLLAWCKIIAFGDCSETALFRWLMLLVLILCTYEINKRPISMTGLKLEEVLREEPMTCCSWWERSNARLLCVLSCMFFLEWTSCASWREEYPSHP